MYETPEISAEILNAAFVNKIESGLHKEAEEAGTAYIRQQLYEEGVLRRLFPPDTITPDELDPSLTDDKPRKILEIEPDAPSATFVAFKGTGPRAYFNGRRFAVPFGKVESDRMSKSKFELMTSKMDIMAWLKENQVKQVQNAEDGQFMATVEGIITDNIAAQATIAGAGDNFKQAFTLGLKGLTSLRLPVGKVLMHKNTYFDSLDLTVEDIGYKLQDKRIGDGVEGEESFMGYPVITTLKTDICPEDVMYFFAPKEYFCSNMLLQDATLYLKVEADMYTFHTYEAPGMGIGNTLGVFRVTIP
jgi:hypothetical protein